MLVFTWMAAPGVMTQTEVGVNALHRPAGGARWRAEVGKCRCEGPASDGNKPQTAKYPGDDEDATIH